MSKTSFHTSPDLQKISSTLLPGQSWRLGLQLFAQARGFKSCASHQPMHQTWMILNLDQKLGGDFLMFEKHWNLNVDPYKFMISNISSPSKFWYFRQLTVTELFETFHHWSLLQKNTSLVIRVLWLMAAPFVWDHIGGIRYLRKWCSFKISCQIIPNPQKWYPPPPQVMTPEGHVILQRLLCPFYVFTFLRRWISFWFAPSHVLSILYSVYWVFEPYTQPCIFLNKLFCSCKKR